MTKPRLELTWICKDARPRLEPCILIEDPAKSCHTAERVTDSDLFDNRLIFGDNLLALKALKAEFTGKVKCVFIPTKWTRNPPKPAPAPIRTRYTKTLWRIPDAVPETRMRCPGRSQCAFAYSLAR